MTAAPAKSWGERVLGSRVVFGLLLTYLLFFFGSADRVNDPDIWWHLRDASVLVHTGHFIHLDTLSFTVAGKPWVDVEWLAELPYYFAYMRLGVGGLYLVMMMLSTAVILGVYCLALQRSQDSVAAFLASVAAVLFATVSLAPRTLLFGWLCLVVELGILWGLEKGRDYTGWLPLLFLVWINLHGSWFLGLGLMLLFFACGLVEGEWGLLYAKRWNAAQKRKLALVTLASVAALFVNPYGWRLVAYPAKALAGAQLGTELIAEWASLNFHTALGKTVLATLLALGLLQVVRGRRWALQDFALAAVGVYGALTYVRFVFLIGILVVPMLACLLRLPAREDRPHKEGRWLNALAMAVLLAMIVMRHPTAMQLNDAIAGSFPQKAVPYVRGLAGKGHLLSEYRWAGYLEWEAPEVEEMIDSRTDIFMQAGVMADYVRAVKVEDTDVVLAKYGIRYVLMPRGSPMAYLLAHETAWKQTYEDGQAVGFERVDRTTNR